VKRLYTVHSTQAKTQAKSYINSTILSVRLQNVKIVLRIEINSIAY
jgi:hypothetical protein